jgi:cellulose synthase/poly-beta-1,6-N-acetylglucosamine synthase-like glycosyltransferase
VEPEAEIRVGQPKVSVIIATYATERLKDVQEAVHSVLFQTLKPHEVIVAVDNHEELFHKLRAELPDQVSVVQNNGLRGCSQTRNTAILCSTGEIIASIDDDAVAEQSWLENLVQPFEDPGVMAVGGKAVPIWPKGRPPFWFPEEFDFVIGCTGHKKLITQSDGQIRNVTGSNMAFRREVFERAGLLDAGFGRTGELGVSRLAAVGGEEAELCMRIRGKIPGAKIMFKPEAVVHHKVTPRRATLTYEFDFCLREGNTRAMLRRTVSRQHYGSMTAENTFLNQLLFKSVPQRLLHFYKASNLAQVGVITANVSLMGTGYFLGRCFHK